MGSDPPSTNLQPNYNQNTPQKSNLYQSYGVPTQKPYRHRLYSDPQDMPKDDEKLQPIRRHSNINVTSFQSNLSGSLKKEDDNNKNNVLPHFERGNKRKMSLQYYDQFRKSHMGNADFLAHLAGSLNKEIAPKQLSYEELSQKYIPKYLFDWRYVDNPQTGGKCWRNLGKILIDKNNFLKMRKLSDKPIGSSEPFYLKRMWLFSYLMNHYGNNTQQNPLITIDRKNIFIDSYNKFVANKELNLTHPLRIHFINEEKDDQESLYREWYSEIFKDMISPNLKLFIRNHRKSLEPNSLLFYPKYPGMNFNYYIFIGKLMIKAIVDLMVVKSAIFNRILLKSISKRPITLEDVKYYDLDLYNQLKIINDYPIRGNYQYEQVRFTYQEMDQNNMIQEYELIPGGKNIFLNDSNKYSFIDKFIYAKVVKPYEEHIKYCQMGLKSIFKTSIEGIFDVEEIKFLLSGLDYIDLNDWKENTIYKGCYNANHPVIKMFWQKLESMKKEEIYKFLEFSTGSGSVPIDGFGCLKGIGGMIQKFTIEPWTNYSAENPDEYKFHPIEARRVNHTIILPLYQSRQEFDYAMNLIINKK